MDEAGNESVMRRKAGAGRAPPEIGQVTAVSCLQSAVAQGAEDVLSLTASALKIDESRTTLAAFTKDLPENALFALCKHDNGETGMVVLDASSLAALIEVQTMGRVSRLATKPRNPTRTDALLCAGFIDQVLKLFEQATADAGLPITKNIAGYAYANPLPDLRTVEMTLDDCPYRLFDLEIDFANGAKTGKVLILLPFERALPEVQNDTSEWSDSLGKVVNCSPVEMEAILARKEILLSEVAEFQVGTLVTIPGSAISEVALIDMNGHGITLGRLGQSSGMRAICITESCADRDPIISRLDAGPAKALASAAVNPSFTPPSQPEMAAMPAPVPEPMPDLMPEPMMATLDDPIIDAQTADFSPAPVDLENA